MACLEGMRLLDDNSVDCVITSPPYNFNLRVHYGEYGGWCKTDRNKYGDTCADRLPIDEYYKYEYGELPYRSERFDFITFDREYFQSEAC